MSPNPKMRPTKLWRGKKRLSLKFLGYRRSILEWAISISPGDWIATCEGCNRQVAEIEYDWVNEGEFRRGKPNRTWVLYEVIFTDTRGRWHHCPGGGCASPKETIKQIENYHKKWIETAKDPDSMPWDCGKFREKLGRMAVAFDSGGTIVDENGEYLPEFDTHSREQK